MEIATLYVAILTFLVSAAPLLVQVIVYGRRLSKYESLQKSLTDQSKRLGKLSKGDTSEFSRITVLLETGDMIMPHVTARFWRRLPALLAVALGTAIFSGAEVKFRNGLSHTNILAMVLVIMNWGLPFATFLKTNLFSKDESDFLRNFGLLHDIFYENVVVDLIKSFNANCKVSNSVAEKQSESRAELQTLKRDLIRRLEAQNAKMRAGESKDGSSGVTGGPRSGPH